jgi:hypothetical protein
MSAIGGGFNGSRQYQPQLVGEHLRAKQALTHLYPDVA